MAYNVKLVAKIREVLAETEILVEKKMFGGVAFMIQDKMCMGVNKDNIMLRCLPEKTEELLLKDGAKPFDLTGKPMKGWLLIEPNGFDKPIDFDWWVKTALQACKQATLETKQKK